MKKRKTIFIIGICTAVIISAAVIASRTVFFNKPDSSLSDDTIDFYYQWKDKYLIKNPYTTENQYYIQYSKENYEQTQSEVAVTVSEAHGYGMLAAACMSEYDREAKSIFDGMYNYYRAHLNNIGPNLMAWQQNDNGSEIINASGADSATDGDMDIAYSLLIADKIWGSNGNINYKDSAISLINDIMTYEVNKTDWTLQLGDWVSDSDGDDKYYSATRSSDFIVQYMPIFAKVTGDERWTKVYNSTYDIINSFVSEYGTGLLPDFFIKDNGKFVPAPPDFLESEHDGDFSYNSCRTPWRISMDYLYGHNSDALAFAETLNSFIQNSTDKNPKNIKAGYTLSGTSYEDYNDLCFTAPFLISAACEGKNKWHDVLRENILDYGDDVYYGDTIKLLCLIADDNGWIVP